MALLRLRILIREAEIKTADGPIDALTKCKWAALRKMRCSRGTAARRRRWRSRTLERRLALPCALAVIITP